MGGVELGVIASTFLLIIPVELPDKTFVAALVLSTRFRPFYVWVGVGAAFFVQTVVAVTAGQLATLLPEWVLLSVAAAIFAIGAVVLLFTARNADAAEKEQEEEFSHKGPDARSGWRAAGASFLVLFAAEWGDLSQLLTMSQVARTHEPLSVFIGAWAALLVISGVAVVAGRVLLRYLRLSVLHYVGAGVCALFAVLTVLELAGL
jgi:putative Ca2+/H+ antiporter (TMEM165/GDT1 family)